MAETTAAARVTVLHEPSAGCGRTSGERRVVALCLQSLERGQCYDPNAEPHQVVRRASAPRGPGLSRAQPSQGARLVSFQLMPKVATMRISKIGKLIPIR
jgi:hypothetical protein